MIYYIYQLTNLINSKIYVGVHKTKNINDGYMGSGKVIKRAIAKHGLHNFKKDILEFFDTSEAMYAREKELVDDAFLLRRDTYNLRRGGTGGFDYINKNLLNVYGNNGKNKSNLKPNIHEYMKSIGQYDEYLAKVVKGQEESIYIIGSHWLGRKHTIESKNKMKVVSKDRQTGSKNSQYGTIWITDGFSNKKIKKEDIIPENWYKGRVKQSVVSVEYV